MVLLFHFQIFPGNKDQNTIKENVFVPSFRARYVRIHPWTWVGHVSMRAEFYVRKICECFSKFRLVQLPDYGVS